MVYVDEVKATLETYGGTNVVADYKLTETDKQICEMVTKQVWGSLNYMFNGLVDFTLDNYFTTKVIGEESFTGGTSLVNGEWFSDN